MAVTDRPAAATTRPPRRTPWPRVPPAFTAAALSGHSAVGLAFGALLYLVCLTGAVSVLVDEIKLAEQPSPQAAVLAPGRLDAAARAAFARSEPADTLYLMAPTTPAERLSVERFGAGGEHAWLVQPDGRLADARTPFADFVSELHMTLTAPAPWGSLLVGVAGAGLLALIVSGVLSHPRAFRDAFRLRLSGSRRLREAELHNRLSVWGLPFHVAVTLTGALFGLTNLAALSVAAVAFHGDTGKVYARLSGPATAPDPHPAPLPDVEALVARALRLRPGSTLAYVGLERPGTRGARVVVQLSAPGRLPRGDQVIFDAAGRELGTLDYASGAPALQAYSAAAQVHFGFFGGLPVRLAYGLFGAGLTYVCATGVSIWLSRRRDRGRPAPRLEQAWSAWTWGAPAALAVSAVLARFAPVPLVFWGVLAAAGLLAQVRVRRPEPGERLGVLRLRTSGRSSDA